MIWVISHYLPNAQIDSIGINKREYAKKNLIQKPLKFNLKTESDLIEWVESLKTPYQTYVKRLIRDDMNKKKQETA